MIKLTTTTYSLNPNQFKALIENYRLSLPNVERICVCLKDPVHQLAALYACLIAGKRAFSQNPLLSESSLNDLDKLFLPQAKLSKEVAFNHDLKLSDEILPEQGLLAIATSGSSGTPKIVLIKPSALIASAQSSSDFYQLQSGDKISSPLPLHHIGGIMPFWRALASKAELILPLNQNWLEACHPLATQISLIPSQLKFLLQNEFNWANFKSIIIGAQALDESTFQLAHKAKLPISISYGSSESIAQLSATAPGDFTHNNVGIILPNRIVKVIEGRVCFKGEASFYGYQNGCEDLFPFDEQGFFRSQDLASFDESDRLIIKGRLDQVYQSGGENINPAELEKKIQAFCNIDECYISPLSDQQFGMVNALSIASNVQSTIHKIINHNQQLSSFEKVRFIHLFNKSDHALKQSRSSLKNDVLTSFSKWNLKQYNRFHKDKKNLVFLHGFLGNSTSMLELAKNFEEEFNIWSLDLPFHGNHTHHDYQNWDQVIDELACLLVRFNNLWLYGYSMGGRLTLGLMDRYPKLVKKAIIEAAHPGLKNEQERRDRSEFENEVINKMDNFSQFLKDWYQSPLFALNGEQIEQLTKLDYNSAHDYASALKTYGLSKQPDLSHLLQESDIVTLAGENDHKYLALLPNPLVIPDCGHKSSFQAPSDVYQLVLQYLAKNNWH